MTDVEKADAEKTEEAKGHNEKKVMLKIPPTSSSLSVLSGFGNQFLNLSSDTFLSPTLLNVPVLVILEQTVLKPTLIVTTITSMLQHTTPIPTPPIISETPPVTIVYDPLPAVIQRLSDLENKFKAWTKVDHFEAIEASAQANVINEVNNQLPKVVKDLVDTRMESKESSKDKTLPKTSKSGKSVTAEEPVEEHVSEMTMDVEENIVDNMGNADEQPDVYAENDPLTFDELMATPIDFSKFAMNHLKLDKITKADLVRPVYKLLKGTCQSSIELEYNMEECYKAFKPLPLKGRPGHLTVAAEFFFNNDLEYVKSASLERTYTTSITKTKAARYELLVDKQFAYEYLKEIMVRRADRKLYTFKEGDFINLHLNDIKEMLLLVVKHKLFHHEGDAIVDLAVALRVVYEDLSNQKRLMRADELYKFSDSTLKSVRDTLHHMLLNFRLGYNKDMPKRDQRWSGIMVNLIDKQLLERWIMRILERLVGARELEMDYRLMQQTVVILGLLS
ncbi:hypothetical protein Tco_0073113 [Tanacetum coccineum]